uniref:Putative salivary lipocalin n=1 Tax=Ixodes ricinus TaxID=34613 RepID=A0A0K8RNN7_IXORI
MKVLVLAPCLFATLMGVSLAAKNPFIDDYWQASVALGSFEKAWEAINKKGVYYLMLTTSPRPYDCVDFNVKEAFTSPKAIHYDVTMYNASIPFTYEYKGTALVLRDVRGIESTIEWIRKEGGHVHKTQVLYTEKDSKCFVLFYPDSKDYELWVYDTETGFIPRCCEFAFTFVTYEVETHLNFNYDICKHVS